MDSSQAENPCPNCGNTTFNWGLVVGAGFAKSYLFLVAKHLAARVCDRCGNVQIFLKDAVQDAFDSSKREKRKRGG